MSRAGTAGLSSLMALRIFMSTCRAWFSSCPLSAWYGMTVVRYLVSWKGFFSTIGLVALFCWLRFSVTWCCLRLFWTASSREMNWFLSSFSYSSSSLRASSFMRVSLSADMSESISFSRSESCFGEYSWRRFSWWGEDRTSLLRSRASMFSE